MATVDLNQIQFWQPPLNPLSSKQHTASPHIRRNGTSSLVTSSSNLPALLHNKADEALMHNDQIKSAVAAAPHQGCNIAFQHEDDAVEAGIAGRDNAHTDYDDEADEFPSIEELWSRNPRQEILAEYQNSEDTLSPEQSRLDDSADGSQGTRDKPVILEDDGSDTPNPEAVTISISVNAITDPPSEPSKEPWYDVEDKCFVDEGLHPIPLFEQKALASIPPSTPAQEQPRSPHHSPGSLQDQINLHDNNKVIRMIPDTTPESEDEDGEGWNVNNIAELEKEVQRSLDGKEKMESTSAPSSLHPDRPSTKARHVQIDQEDDYSRTSHGRFEELRRSSPLYRQDQEEVQEQQQRREVITELMRKEDDDGDNEMSEPQGEKQQRQDRNKEINRDNHHPKGSYCSYTTSNEEDDGDEDPRPAKRRKLFSASTENALTPPDELTPVDHDHCNSSRASRSPSATVESALVAEYQEWPFQGFLKRVQVGNEITYNLECTLPEHLQLPIHWAILSTGPIDGLSEHSKPPMSQCPTKLVKWTTEEDHDQWSMRKVIGRKTIDNEIYYRVDWVPTWEPESGLAGAEELIDKYLATLKPAQGRGGLNEGEPKKRRGRPRKQQ